MTCPITTSKGEPCGMPLNQRANKPQDPTCYDHMSSSPGIGEILCDLCKHPQTEHDLGYWSCNQCDVAHVEMASKITTGGRPFHRDK